MNCNLCKDTGLIKNTRYDFYQGCSYCIKGTSVRKHIMMHSQDSSPCNCEYRYIIDYWSDNEA